MHESIQDWLDGLVHLVGLLGSVVGLVLLLKGALQTGDVWKVSGVAVFGACLILMYTNSMLYHGMPRSRFRGVLKMVDHCAIFLLIAGTYTPFVLVNLHGPSGWWLFNVIWTLALIGIALKLVHGHALKTLRLVVYLGMGWLVVTVGRELMDNLPPRALFWLVAGGVSYTLGVVFYLAEKWLYSRVIWHLCVVGGSTSHYCAVYYGVLPY